MNNSDLKQWLCINDKAISPRLLYQRQGTFIFSQFSRQRNSIQISVNCKRSQPVLKKKPGKIWTCSPLLNLQGTGTMNISCIWILTITLTWYSKFSDLDRQPYCPFWGSYVGMCPSLPEHRNTFSREIFIWSPILSTAFMSIRP